MVASTTEDYFVLYVKHDEDGTEVKQPVLVKRGEAGTTTLAENIPALPAERYMVEKYSRSDPADVDGDCVYDITELDDFGHMNPVNPAPSIDQEFGAVAVPDHKAFDSLANTILGNTTIKFVVLTGDPGPRVYFMNTNNYESHDWFVYAIGDEKQSMLSGTLIYDPDSVAPDGSPGVYRYHFSGPDWLSRRYSATYLERVHDLLAASMPLLEDNLALWIHNDQLSYLRRTVASLKMSRVPVEFDDDI